MERPPKKKREAARRSGAMDRAHRETTEVRLKATNRLLALFASKTTRKAYLDAVCDLLVELGGCRAVGLRLLNGQGQIPYEAAWGFNAKFIESECWLSVEHDHCACTRVVRGRPEPPDRAMMTPGGSFHCNDTFAFLKQLTKAEQARFRGVCIRTGFATVAVVPIQYRGQTSGAIHFADRRPGRLDRFVVDFMEAMAPLVGEAVYRFNIETALRQSEERYRRIVEAATEGIWILDRDDRTVFVNQRLAEMFGYSVSEMIGKAMDEFMDDEWRAAANLAMQHRGIAGRHDFKFRRKDGCEVWGFLSSTPIRDDSGRYDGALAMVADITERRRLEQEVLNANDAVCRRIGQDLHDSLGQILIGLTFQSRNMERRLASMSREHAAEAARITATAKEAATLARSLAHGLCPVQITPGGLMAALRELARQTARTFRIRCTLTAHVSALIRDSVAAGHVYQIVQEAITNAVRHGKASHISISLKPVGPRIALRVRDNGVGLPKGKAAAKGLGLRTMQYRAGLIGGSCDIEPGPGGGTMVTCWLPAGGSVAAQKAKPATAANL